MARRAVLLRVAGMAGAVGVVCTVSCLGTATAAQPTGSFTSLSSPLTAAVDYITGFPSRNGIGPIGMLDDGKSFYVVDAPANTLSRYEIGQPAPEPLIKTVQTSLTDGLALDNGGYYGVVGGAFQSTTDPGVYTFDPTTLALGPEVIPAAPCSDTRGLATDPSTGDLYLTGDCGLWRITGLASGHPTKSQLADGNLDGITVGPDGTVWVADVGVGVEQFSPDGKVLTVVGIDGGADGVAIAGSTAAAALQGDLFVNDNDGTITMVDVHDNDATSIVASGGSRGDFVTVGPDGFLYATQADRVEQVQPDIFNPVIPPSKTTDSPTPTTTTAAAAATTTSEPTTGAAPAAGQSAELPNTGVGNTVPLLALGLLATLCGAGVLIWSRRATRSR